MAIFSAYDLEYAYRAPMVYDLRQYAQSGYTYTDYRSLCKYLSNALKDFPNIAYYIVFSSTASDKDCKRIVINDGHSGRPKHMIQGNKILPHVHCLFLDLSPETTIDKAELRITKHLRYLHAKKANIKRYTGRQFDDSKSPSLHAGNFYRYCYKQADNECFGGAEHNWHYYDSFLWSN